MAVVCTSVVALLVQASVWPKVGAAKDTYQQAVKMQQEGRRARAWCTRRTSREGFAVHEREWRRAAGDQDARRVPRPVVRLHVLTHWPCALTVGSRAWLLGPK